MRQIRISKRRPSARRLGLVSEDPLPLDPRDPDIVHAKELARRRAHSARRRAA